MDRKFVIFVNTTDSFSDCWYPFFKLFETYWPNYTGEIYLNTEFKTFHFKNLNIISICNKKNNWSDSVAYALNKIESDYILYLQDDYFFKDFIKTELLYEYFQIMIDNDFDCLHLTDQHSSGPFHETKYKKIVEIDKLADYRISCQAAIWKKSVFLEYLISGESGWDFEKYGTIKSRYLKHNFYSVSRDLVQLNNFEIIPYIFTGIVRGKWVEEVVNLFQKNNIEIDFEIRGFFNPYVSKPIKQRIISRINSSKKWIKNQFLILRIKIITLNQNNES